MKPVVLDFYLSGPLRLTYLSFCGVMDGKDQEKESKVIYGRGRVRVAPHHGSKAREHGFQKGHLLRPNNLNRQIMTIEADDTLKLCAVYPRLLLKSNTNRGPSLT